MASIITLAGIDNAISSLNYSNKNTLKYKYVHHIRQYYSNKNSVESVGEIDNEELIKILWDTGGNPESIKKKRKNLNSLRSSVNADLKKLYISGKNSEGVKIGSGNIFVMLDDAKDKILNEYGYDLKPEGTLKLDQIMNILRLANESVSGSLALEEKGEENGLGKIDQLKRIIKGLSEKVGLSSSQLSETDHKNEGAPDDSKGPGKVGHLGEVSNEIVGEGGGEGNFETVDDLQADEVLEEIEDLADDEVLEEVEDLADVSDEIIEEDDIEEDFEAVDDLSDDEVLEEVGDVDPGDLIEGPEDGEGVGGQDDMQGAGMDQDSGLSGSGDGPDGFGALEEDISMGLQFGDMGDGHSGVGEGVSSGDGIEPDHLETDESSEAMETDDSKSIEEIEDLSDDEVLEEVEDIADVSDEITEEAGIGEDFEAVEDLSDDEVLEGVEDIEDVSEEITEEVEIGEDFEAVDDLQDDEVLEEVEDLADDSDEITEEAGIGENFESVEDLADDEVLEEVEDLADVSDEITEEVEIGEDFEAVEDLQDDEVLEEVEDLADVSDEITEEAEIEEDFESVDDLQDDEVLEEVGDVDPDDLIEGPEDGERVGGQDDLQGAGMAKGPGEGDENFDQDNSKDCIKKTESEKGAGEIGLPVDSLGKKYSDEVSDKVKKNRLLSEEFDGYLGVMDRYYNHYILIPGGEYIVGSQKPGKNETPEHLVILSPFYIGRFPVTNGLFEIFIEKTGYKTVAEKVGYGNVYFGRCQRKKDEKTGLITSIWNSSLYSKIVEGACWYQPFGPGSTLHNKRNHPVVQISLEDAMAFAAWTGKRLPTEEEWEAAARTQKGWSFPWGKKWKKHYCNIEDSLVGGTTPVDKYAEFENELGIVDTMGNILEWTLDNFTALSNNKNRPGCHIAKGGSWISENDIRLFSRFKIAHESHSNILGFRCVAH